MHETCLTGLQTISRGFDTMYSAYHEVITCTCVYVFCIMRGLKEETNARKKHVYSHLKFRPTLERL